MLKIFSFLLSFSMVLFVSGGCQQASTPTGGGIGVGNGVRSPKNENTFYSARYHFGFQYPQDFKLSISSEERLRLQSVHSPTKGLQFDIFSLKQKINSMNELIQFANRKHERDNARFKTYKLQRSKLAAVGWLDPDLNHRFKQNFYFLVSSQTLIRILGNFDLSSPQWIQIQKVLHSLTYDGVPPEILHLSLKSPFGLAGKTALLQLKAQDNFSGLIGGKLKVRLTHLETGQLFSIEHSLSKRNQIAEFDYEIPFEIPPWVNHGIFELDLLELTDLANNTRFLRLQKELNQTRYELIPPQQKELKFPNFPTVILSLANLDQNIDRQAPQVETVKLIQSKFILNSEEPLFAPEVEMIASDDAAGIVGGKVQVLFEQLEGRLKGAKIETSHTVTRENSMGNHRYRFALPIGRNLPSGEYKALQVLVSDRSTPDLLVENFLRFDHFLYAINHSSVRNFNLEFDLDNQGTQDLAAPEITSLKVQRSSDPHSWLPPRLLIEAGDADSGLLSGKIDVTFSTQLEDGSTFSFEQKIKVIAPNHLEGGFISIPLELPSFAPHGDYSLSRISLYDLAQNSFQLECPTGINSPQVTLKVFGTSSPQPLHSRLLRCPTVQLP